MIIPINEILFNVEVDEENLKKNLTPIIFLHGFTGSSQEWKFLFHKLNGNYLPVAIDLIGHGTTESPDDAELYSAHSISLQLNQIITKLGFEKVILCGYSMGGRAALSYYSRFPERVAGLILESSTPGIQELQLKEERIKSDNLLALKIEQEGVENFCKYWLNLPLFETLKTLPDEENKTILNKKINNNSVGLINSLKSFGTGIMPHLWNKIEEINFPVMLVTGEYDNKFSAINERVNQKIENSNHQVVCGCGHNVHLEKPEEFCNLVNRYLSDNIF